jgi:hypothetical protein
VKPENINRIRSRKTKIKAILFQSFEGNALLAHFQAIEEEYVLLTRCDWAREVVLNENYMKKNSNLVCYCLHKAGLVVQIALRIRIPFAPISCWQFAFAVHLRCIHVAFAHQIAFAFLTFI